VTARTRLQRVTAMASAMSEADLQLRITSGTRREPGLCAQLGLIWYHPHDSRRSPHGWPDLVIARRHVKGYSAGAALFAELKSENGKVTPEQEEWLEALTWAGCTTRVWRPGQLLDGTIARELAALAGMGGAHA